ncbi:ABC transporter substrate-binding protein [Pontibacillus yanchengensis]|uniref:ABC transporter substrate-binding protein n=2 Tax=Pontibacillus yanchengensis TaxID=462910 RepID=A0ACC7VEH0_9BACI|nr:ABC transporter substrate-binding protein [Pontibacillus yanchengensis]MYL32511.1 ABC transporter substrate-binding protein [Pontibacillus yanchengensis]MYL53092.1 ABC transporter substrate-binding protein [Pontibacillus yanchengensis]
MKKLFILLSLALLVALGACGSGGEKASSKKKIETITFADAGWDSIRVHNSIAQTIIEEGFGYDTDVTTGSTPATVQGVRQGDINVHMEMWTDNIKKVYAEAIEAGDFKEVSVNFDDNKQGLWVPTYVIEGDDERGIEPAAPDLKTVEDLKKYPELFQDPEKPSKGRIIGSPSGWAVGEILATKVETYGLDEQYNYFRPGSDAAIVTSLTDAYNAGEPWVGYYWSPTWVTAVYDMTLLDEPDYNKDQWEKDRSTEFPPNKVTIVVHNEMTEQAPNVVDFLSNYETSSELTGESLKYMKENDASAEEAAIWWMKKHEDLWTEWVSKEVAKKVIDAL